MYYFNNYIIISIYGNVFYNYYFAEVFNHKKFPKSILDFRFWTFIFVHF